MKKLDWGFIIVMVIALSIMGWVIAKAEVAERGVERIKNMMLYHTDNFDPDNNADCLLAGQTADSVAYYLDQGNKAEALKKLKGCAKYSTKGLDSALVVFINSNACRVVIKKDTTITSLDSVKALNFTAQ